MIAATMTRRRAFTLAELAVSMAVSVVLLGGLASALVIASHALPGSDSPSRATLGGTIAVEQIASDLHCATSFSEFTLTSIAFSVPDRNHGAVGAEKIRYAWSGVVGDPLTLQYNGGTIMNIVSGLEEFSFTYDLEAVGKAVATPGQTYPFIVVADYPWDAGVAEMASVVSTDTWCGEYITPDPATLPVGTSSWKVDRVYFRLKDVGKGKSSGKMTILQLRTANADRTPGAKVIDELLIDAGSLSTSSWTTLFWDPVGVPWSTPTTGVCLVFKPESTPETCSVLFQAVSIPSGNVSFLKSIDTGVTFSVDNAQTMTAFTVYATAKTPDGSSPSLTSLMRRVEIGLRGEGSAFVDTSVEVLNQTEVATP